MSSARGCCCGTESGGCLRDCISSTTIESGCCHKSDTLLLWNHRPGFVSHQQYVGSSGCETCKDVTQFLLPPVESIYHFHSCRYIIKYATLDQPSTLIELPVDNNDFGQGEACANPVCNPAYAVDDCCSTQFPDPDCLCNSWYGASRGGLSQWRKDQLNIGDTGWFIDMECHSNGIALVTGAIPPLNSYWRANIFFERWWRIADCVDGVRIHVPPGNNELPYVTSDLVPKWFIYACSGIPAYQFEFDEALSMGIIDGGEYADLMNAFDNHIQPSTQAGLVKMGNAGYFGAKDYRAEQRQAFIDLNAKFPNEGYAQCIQPLNNMHTLGPFRKRYTHPNPCGYNRPFLHKNDVNTYIDDLQAECMINYPGDCASEEDYLFWRERQWVYFRGIPAGWTWVGWNAASGTGLSEEEAIAEGYGRGDGLNGGVLGPPLEAFRGEPRPNPTCSACSASGCPGNTFCDTCINPCPNCGDGPVGGCDPPEVCRKFALAAECEGVHFTYSQYYWSNDINSLCQQAGKYVCLYTIHSYLVEAQRSRNSWADAIPWTCRDENPPLPVFTGLNIPFGRHGSPMCSEILNPTTSPPLYTIIDMCCGGACVGFTYTDYLNTPNDPTDDYPCPGNGPQAGCVQLIDCPEFDATGQVPCIGHDLDCDPTP